MPRRILGVQGFDVNKSIELQWYSKPTWLWCLVPLSGLFILFSRIRRFFQQKNAYRAHCPLIVVGNIAIGGTGKTPVIIALVEALKTAGFKPAVVSRGYRSQQSQHSRLPKKVPLNAKASEYGDEPVLIAASTHCPVWISRDRVAAVKAAERSGCDVILSDDGLQHYKMARSFELVVQDASRGIGNGWCLPVGPLRELPIRLQQADYVLSNITNNIVHSCVDPEPLLPPEKNFMYLKPTAWVNVKSGKRASLSQLPWRGETGTRQRVFAVAGIGNPERFFNTLESLDIKFEKQSFKDHHQFTDDDFTLVNGRPVVMTAKDAVKCKAIAQSNWWYLSVEAKLPADLLDRIIFHCRQFASASEPQELK